MNRPPGGSYCTAAATFVGGFTVAGGGAEFDTVDPPAVKGFGYVKAVYPGLAVLVLK